ncbi:MAG TPA: diguanylate cyclase [Solirubrobacteraceae bacterium]|nr:diguanylate cyclase [Solirubrobacteraceae bacterium]
MDVVDPGRIASARSVAPFAVAAALAWLTVPISNSVNWTEYAVATALLPVCLLCGLWLKTGVGRVVPSLIFLAALGLLRNAGGGIVSGASAVAIAPVFYVALYSDSRRDLYLLLAGLAIFYIVPILLVGPPAYPHTQYRAALLVVAVSSIIGLATQRLVAATRERTQEARERERMLEELSVVVRGLFSSEDARVDVCAAARKIGQASVVVLYEPGADPVTMRATAHVGIAREQGEEPTAIEIPIERPTAVREVFETGRPLLITEEVERHVGSVQLWIAAGRPASVLYEPLLRQGQTIGVLVVGWPGEVNANGARRKVVELLAHEAAAVLTRADALSALSDQASTDPLTGLPNRRAWDASLAEALRDGAVATVAILDLDHFKQYNDTYGHPAGDRLLKESAAMWREQLRSGDLLARIGGEEFGLLLPNCDRSRALDVIERLRGAVYHERTCSVGFAVHLPGETAEQVMARADAALYEAKEAGRDRVRMSAGLA